MSSNITDADRKAFEALASGKYSNFALFSCFVNGEPACAIVSIDVEGKEYLFEPLFVSITDRMILTDHRGKEPRKDPRKDPPNPTRNGADKADGGGS